MNDPTPPTAAPVSPPQAPAEDTPHTSGAVDNPSADAPTITSDPRPPAVAPAGAPTISGYAVVRKIGEGGMGAVYLAEDIALGRRAAIKTMKPEIAANPGDRDRFLREARAAAAVEHDNVVPIWGVGVASDGSPFLAMPFLRGEMLDSRLRREPVPSLGVLLQVAREVADGLAAAHAKGLIHRDIKPGNVWLEGDLDASEPGQQLRRCKILDFGLARSVGGDDAQITASGAILGTPAYMAPEQARGEKVDHRADLFSLGVMLYRMATGALPFRGSTAMAVLISLTTDTPAPAGDLNPNLPPALSDLIGRLMSKEPDGRPQSAAEVAAAIRRIARELWASGAFDPDAPTAALPLVRVPLLPADRGADPASGSVPRVLTADDPTARDPSEPPRPPAPPPKRRAPWLLAAAVGLLALVPVVLWSAGVFGGKKPAPEVTEKTKDEEKAPKPGNEPGMDGPNPVELGPAPRVILPAPLPPAPPDPDRAAANYVCSLGGCVWVNDAEKEIKADGALPAEPFRLNQFQFLDNSPVTDAGLAAFAGCRNLLSLGLSDLPVGDAGLSHFKECKELRYLYLRNTRVTSKGLTALKDCVELLELDLTGSQVDDTAVEQLKRCTHLHALFLGQTKVTAAGVAALTKALPGCQIEWDGAIGTDRAAAEYVLSVGGGVSISEGNAAAVFVKAANELPPRPFRVKAVWLRDNAKVTDEGLAAFKGCTHVATLHVGVTQIGDAGLAHFAGCKGLANVDFQNARLSDAGLVHLRGRTGLTELNLIGCAGVSDAGLANLKGCTALTVLHLAGTQVSDQGLDLFKGCKSPLQLNLFGTSITDDGLNRLRGMNLKTLNLQRTKVTAAGVAAFAHAMPGCAIVWDGGAIEAGTEADRKAAEWVLAAPDADGVVEVNGIKVEARKGQRLPEKGVLRLTEVELTPKLKGNVLGVTKDADLAVFRGCKNVTGLVLVGTGITKDGLAHFGGCKRLKSLYLSGTKAGAAVDVIKGFPELTDLILGGSGIDEKGVQEIANALPLCRIQFGYTIEPASDADRKAAEYVLSIGGKVGVNGSDMRVAAPADLPNGLFRLTAAITEKSRGLPKEPLSAFAECKNLTHFRFGSKLSEDALKNLDGCKRLAHIDLVGAAVTDADLFHLRDHSLLSQLWLAGSTVGDNGLAHLKGCSQLTFLDLSSTKVTDAGLNHLKGCSKLTTLWLSGTNVTPKASATLKQLTALTNLQLDGTKFQPDDTKALAKELPNCRIKDNEGITEPKGK